MRLSSFLVTAMDITTTRRLLPRTPRRELLREYLFLISRYRLPTIIEPASMFSPFRTARYSIISLLPLSRRQVLRPASSTARSAEFLVATFTFFCRAVTSRTRAGDTQSFISTTGRTFSFLGEHLERGTRIASPTMRHRWAGCERRSF